MCITKSSLKLMLPHDLFHFPGGKDDNNNDCVGNTGKKINGNEMLENSSLMEIYSHIRWGALTFFSILVSFFFRRSIHIHKNLHTYIHIYIYVHAPNNNSFETRFAPLHHFRLFVWLDRLRFSTLFPNGTILLNAQIE